MDAQKNTVVTVPTTTSKATVVNIVRTRMNVVTMCAGRRTNTSPVSFMSDSGVTEEDGNMCCSTVAASLALDDVVTCG